VNTDGALTMEQVVKAAGLLNGRNIFSYKLDVARETIRALPQVESVEIRRYLPNRIELTIKERKPVAWVTAVSARDPNEVERTHLIGAGGMIFKPKQVLAQYQALPVIFGVPVGDLPAGKPVLMAEVLAALDLLQRVRESGDFHIVSMDISKGYCVVVTDQRGTKITFGLDDLPGQLRRLADVQKEASQIGQDIKTVNVMVVRNIPVVLMPQPEPQSDVEELLREPSLKEAPRPRVVNPPDADTKAGKSSPKKSEPTKSKEPSRRENEPLLRPFRRV
jgi:cell division septal protein FtsQ